MGFSNDFHFRVLESFLDHVKDSAGETVSTVLAIDGEFISSLSLGIEGTVATAMKILRSLKDLAMTLHALWKAVENGLTTAQKKLVPITRHHGILSLPLEIVAQIFRQVYDDDADCATQSILLVNRHFRDIAIWTPQLWTCLTSDRDPRLFMERSKPLGLDVTLASGPHCRRFLEMVAPEAERWTSLSMPPVLDPKSLRSASEILTGNSFTAIRELRIGEDSYLDHPLHFDQLNSVWKILTSRIIKSIPTIKARNTLPTILPTSLTCFHLHVGDPHLVSCRTNIDLNEIILFLQSVPLLIELSLDVGWFKTVTTFRTGTEATLPNVKTLRLTVKPAGYADSSLTDFLASVHTSNLSHLSVNVVAYYASKLIDWISAIFPKTNSFWHSLDSLDLSMTYQYRDQCVWGALDDLFERIPAVHHLSISAKNVVPPSPHDWNVQVPHLRTLCFRDCNEFDTDSILDIGSILEAPGFETLRIHNCKDIDTEVVRERMPKGKAFISTVDWNDDISVL